MTTVRMSPLFAIVLFLFLVLVLVPHPAASKATKSVKTEWSLTPAEREALFGDEPIIPPPSIRRPYGEASPPTPDPPSPDPVPPVSPPAPATRNPSSSSSPVAPLPFSPTPFPDDFNGVLRLMSLLFSPTSISHPGDWQLSLHLPPTHHAQLTRILKRRSPADTLDLISLGEQLIRDATFQPTPATRDFWTAQGEGVGSTLAWVLDGVQGRATQVVEASHERLFAPAGLSASPSHSALWLQLLLVACSAIAGWLASTYLRPSSTPASASVAAGGSVPQSPATRRAAAVVGEGSGGRRQSKVVQARPQSLAAALWTGLLLVLVVLFIGGYVHHYHTLYIQQRAKNRVLQAHPPHNCFDSSPPSLMSAAITAFHYITKSANNDACAQWLAALDQSSYPNPLVVFASYLGVTVLAPVPHVGTALGAFVQQFLNHFGVLTQAAMMVFLLLLLLGCVALCMLLGQQCVVRMGMGSGRRGRRERVRAGELMDEESDDEDDRRRGRQLRLRAAKRKEDERRVVAQQRYLMPADEEGSDEEVDEEEEEEEQKSRSVRRRHTAQPRAEPLSASPGRGQRVKQEEGKEGQPRQVEPAVAKEGGDEGRSMKVKEETVVKEEQVKVERVPASSSSISSPARPPERPADTSPRSDGRPPTSDANTRSEITYI